MIYRSLFITANVLFFFSTSTFASIKFDPDLVRPWSKTDKVQFPTPLVAVFQKSNKTLIFVGDHHKDPAKTYEFSKKAIEKYLPDIIVIESLEFNKGKNPKHWISKYAGKSKEEVWKDPTLGSGTELLATARHIPIIGGEPSIEDEISSPFLIGKGFDSDDIRNVQILQQTPYRRDQLKISNLDIFFDYALKLYKVKEAKTDFKPKFFSWYRKRTQKEFDYNTISKSDTDVNCATNDTFLQKIACTININRDRALVEHVEILLKSHQRVMVVYGTGHFVQEYPVYLKAFGQEPVYL